MYTIYIFTTPTIWGLLFTGSWLALSVGGALWCPTGSPPNPSPDSSAVAFLLLWTSSGSALIEIGGGELLAEFPPTFPSCPASSAATRLLCISSSSSLIKISDFIDSSFIETCCVVLLLLFVISAAANPKKFNGYVNSFGTSQ